MWFVGIPPKQHPYYNVKTPGPSLQNNQQFRVDNDGIVFIAINCRKALQKFKENAQYEKTSWISIFFCTDINIFLCPTLKWTLLKHSCILIWASFPHMTGRRRVCTDPREKNVILTLDPNWFIIPEICLSLNDSSGMHTIEGCTVVLPAWLWHNLLNFSLHNAWYLVLCCLVCDSWSAMNNWTQFSAKELFARVSIISEWQMPFLRSYSSGSPTEYWIHLGLSKSIQSKLQIMCLNILANTITV